MDRKLYPVIYHAANYLYIDSITILIISIFIIRSITILILIYNKILIIYPDKKERERKRNWVFGKYPC